MQKNAFHVSPIVRLKLAILFVFFMVLELRWQVDVFITQIPNPYILLAFMCVVLVAWSCIAGYLYMIKITPLQMVVLGLCCYFIVIGMVNFSDVYEINASEAITEIAVSLINLALILVAWDKDVYSCLLSNRKLVTKCFLLLASSPIFFMLAKGGWAGLWAAKINYRLFIYAYTGELDIHGVYASYQSFGRAIAIFGFFVFSIQQKAVKRFLICILTLFALYINGGMAAFFAYAFAICVYCFIAIWKDKNKMKIVAAGMIGMFIFALVAINLISHKADLATSDFAILQVIGQGKNFDSFASRAEIETENRRIRKENFLLGDYKFDLKMGRPGTPTHTLLGIMEYYGILCFLVYACLRIYLMIKLVLKKEHNGISVFALLAIMFSNLQVCFAYSGTAYIDFFIIGAAVCALNNSGFIVGNEI